MGWDRVRWDETDGAGQVGIIKWDSIAEQVSKKDRTGQEEE